MPGNPAGTSQRSRRGASETVHSSRGQTLGKPPGGGRRVRLDLGATAKAWAADSAAAKIAAELVPAEPVWRTVSAAAASCVDANTASTAAIIKGRAAPGWLAGAGLPARPVSISGAVHTVGGWPSAGGS